MCGITLIFQPDVKKTSVEDYLRKRRIDVVKASERINHRGPDWTGVYQDSVGTMACSMAHERLSIIDPEGGSQPIVSHDKLTALCVNGEIYNHTELRQKYPEYKFMTGSDCEVIQTLYYQFSQGNISYMDIFNTLDGQFSFVLYDRQNHTIIIARDPIGITSLYYGFTKDGEICVASELKAIDDLCLRVKEFLPGQCAMYNKLTKNLNFTQYYKPKWDVTPYCFDQPMEKTAKILNHMLTQAVEKRLMSDVPFGVLLSGGLDSALISSIAMRLVKKNGTKFGNTLHSFSIGMEGSPDLAAAQKVADFIGTHHHTFKFTFDDGLDSISKVIKTLETYDVTTIRASTPMYLLSRMIKAMGIKMVLSGEGADEILGGYLYFHKAPTFDAFHEECKERVKNLHNFDCLRANKSTMAWGLEARVPFLDKEFLEMAMPIFPSQKCARASIESDKKIEKYILRMAFKDDKYPYLPEKILWRQKEQFSDGVGYGWIDGLKAHANSIVSDDEFRLAEERYPYNTPATKEAYWYRTIFEEHYPRARAEETVSKWVPRTDWGCDADPSGRSQGVHEGHDEWKK